MQKDIANNNIETKEEQKNEVTEAEVLYQRIGGKWYAFSLVNDEVFFGAVTADTIEASSVLDNVLELESVQDQSLIDKAAG